MKREASFKENNENSLGDMRTVSAHHGSVLSTVCELPVSDCLSMEPPGKLATRNQQHKYLKWELQHGWNELILEAWHATGQFGRSTAPSGKVHGKGSTDKSHVVVQLVLVQLIQVPRHPVQVTYVTKSFKLWHNYVDWGPAQTLQILIDKIAQFYQIGSEGFILGLHGNFN